MVFSEASLTLVAVRKSFYGSALFLCRSQSSVSRPIFLSVDDAHYKWVETLQVGQSSGFGFGLKHDTLTGTVCGSVCLSVVLSVVL